MVKEVLAWMAGSLVAIVLMIALGWIVEGNEFFMHKFFAPKTAAVQREVFEETKSYNQGMVQELQNMQFEYLKSTPTQKEAMKSVILHRAADYPIAKMPVDLRNFISELKNGEK